MAILKTYCQIILSNHSQQSALQEWEFYQLLVNEELTLKMRAFSLRYMILLWVSPPKRQLLVRDKLFTAGQTIQHSTTKIKKFKMSPKLLKYLKKISSQLSCEEHPQYQGEEIEPQTPGFIPSYTTTNLFQKYRHFRKYLGLSFPSRKMRGLGLICRFHSMDKWNGIILSTTLQVWPPLPTSKGILFCFILVCFIESGSEVCKICHSLPPILTQWFCNDLNH